MHIILVLVVSFSSFCIDDDSVFILHILLFQGGLKMKRREGETEKRKCLMAAGEGEV